MTSCTTNRSVHDDVEDGGEDADGAERVEGVQDEQPMIFHEREASSDT